MYVYMPGKSSGNPFTSPALYKTVFSYNPFFCKFHLKARYWTGSSIGNPTRCLLLISHWNCNRIWRMLAHWRSIIDGRLRGMKWVLVQGFASLGSPLWMAEQPQRTMQRGGGGIVERGFGVISSESSCLLRGPNTRSLYNWQFKEIGGSHNK